MTSKTTTETSPIKTAYGTGDVEAAVQIADGGKSHAKKMLSAITPADGFGTFLKRNCVYPAAFWASEAASVLAAYRAAGNKFNRNFACILMLEQIAAVCIAAVAILIFKLVDQRTNTPPPLLPLH